MAANATDAIIGRNLARLRSRKSITQEDLAARMRRRYSYKWSKATVWSIERGERPLKLAEAKDALKCLGCDPVADLGLLLQGDSSSSLLVIKQRVVDDKFRDASFIVVSMARAYVELFDEAIKYHAELAEDEDEGKDLPKLLEKYAPSSLTWVLGCLYKEEIFKYLYRDYAQEICEFIQEPAANLTADEAWNKYGERVVSDLQGLFTSLISK